MISKRNPERSDFAFYDAAESRYAIEKGKLLIVYGNGSEKNAHRCAENLFETILGIRFDYLSLEKSFKGKPFLPGNLLNFNISHTENAFLIAIYKAEEIGVDLEKIRENDDLNSLAEYAFSPDERVFFVKNYSNKTFLGIWTMKEAYLKATGLGMVDSLHSLHVVSEPGFGVIDKSYGSFIFGCPGGETGSIVFRGRMPEIRLVKISDS